MSDTSIQLIDDPAFENADLLQNPDINQVLTALLLQELGGKEKTYRDRGASTRGGIVNIADFALGGFLGEGKGLLSQLFYDKNSGASNLGRQLFGEDQPQDKQFILQLAKLLSTTSQSGDGKQRSAAYSELAEQRGALDRVFDYASRQAEAGDAVSLPLFKGNLRLDGSRFVEAWAIGREDVPQDVAKEYDDFLGAEIEAYMLQNPEATPNDVNDYIQGLIVNMHGDALTRINQAETDTENELDDATYGRMKQAMSVQNERLSLLAPGIVGRIYRNNQIDRSIRQGSDLVSLQFVKEYMPTNGTISGYPVAPMHSVLKTVDTRAQDNYDLYIDLIKGIKKPKLSDKTEDWENYQNKILNAAETAGVMNYQMQGIEDTASAEAGKIALSAMATGGVGSTLNMPEVAGTNVPTKVKTKSTLSQALSLDDIDRMTSAGIGYPPVYSSPTPSLDELERQADIENPFFPVYKQQPLKTTAEDASPEKSMTTKMEQRTFADTEVPATLATKQEQMTEEPVQTEDVTYSERRMQESLISSSDASSETTLAVESPTDKRNQTRNEKNKRAQDFANRGSTYDAELVEELEFALDHTKEQWQNDLKREGAEGIFKSVINNKYRDKIDQLESDIKIARGKKSKKSDGGRAGLMTQLMQDQKFYDRASENYQNLRSMLEEAVSSGADPKMIEEQLTQLNEQYWYIGPLRDSIADTRAKIDKLMAGSK